MSLRPAFARGLLCQRFKSVIAGDPFLLRRDVASPNRHVMVLGPEGSNFALCYYDFMHRRLILSAPTGEQCGQVILNYVSTSTLIARTDPPYETSFALMVRLC